MKRLIVLVSLLVFSISAQAQMGGGEGQQMPMMQMCMPMMKQNDGSRYDDTGNDADDDGYDEYAGENHDGYKA